MSQAELHSGIPAHRFRMGQTPPRETDTASVFRPDGWTCKRSEVDAAVKGSVVRPSRHRAEDVGRIQQDQREHSREGSPSNGFSRNQERTASYDRENVIRVIVTCNPEESRWDPIPERCIVKRLIAAIQLSGDLAHLLSRMRFSQPARCCEVCTLLCRLKRGFVFAGSIFGVLYNSDPPVFEESLYTFIIICLPLLFCLSYLSDFLVLYFADI